MYKSKIMNYLFLVFAKHKNQEELVNIISNDISVVSKEGSIKYYYGPESMIFTFKSDDYIESLNQFFHMLYGEIDMVFMLLPYSTDNMSVKMGDEIYNHLFDNDINEQKTETFIQNDSEAQKLYDEFQEKFGKSFIESIGECEEDEITSIKSKKKEPTLNELLDKINETGISSLSKKELHLLDKFSKK